MSPSRKTLFGSVQELLSPKSLSSRLTALILATAIPLAGLMAYDQLTFRKKALRLTLDSARRLVSLLFDNYHTTADGARQLLSALARTPYALPGREVTDENFLPDILTQHPQYLNVGVINMEGR